MANEAAGSCVIEAGGKKFDHFVSFQLKRSKEETTCSGQVVLSWPGAEQFNSSKPPAQELVDGAQGTILLDGQLAAKIVLDTRISKGSPTHFELTIQFRGKASVLVDAVPKHETGQENKKKPPEVMKKLMNGYKPKLIDKTKEGKVMERFIVAEGESVDRAMRRVAREHSLTFYENEEGDIIVEDANSEKSSGMTFKLGKNFTDWSVKRDIVPRYDDIELLGNGVPTDEKYAKGNEDLLGRDKRKLKTGDKLLRGHVDGDHDKDSLKKRTKYEAERRAAQGLNATLKLSTWSDDGGKLWKVGTKHQVIIPVDQVNEELEIIEVQFEMTPTTRTATITLVSKETFDDKPQPKSTPLLTDAQGNPSEPSVPPGNIPQPPGP